MNYRIYCVFMLGLLSACGYSRQQTLSQGQLSEVNSNEIAYLDFAYEGKAQSFERKLKLAGDVLEADGPITIPWPAPEKMALALELKGGGEFEVQTARATLEESNLFKLAQYSSRKIDPKANPQGNDTRITLHLLRNQDEDRELMLAYQRHTAVLIKLRTGLVEKNVRIIFRSAPLAGDVSLEIVDSRKLENLSDPEISRWGTELGKFVSNGEPHSLLGVVKITSNVDEETVLTLPLRQEVVFDDTWNEYTINDFDVAFPAGARNYKEQVTFSKKSEANSKALLIAEEAMLLEKQPEKFQLKLPAHRTVYLGLYHPVAEIIKRENVKTIEAGFSTFSCASFPNPVPLTAPIERFDSTLVNHIGGLEKFCPQRSIYDIYANPQARQICPSASYWNRSYGGGEFGDCVTCSAGLAAPIWEGRDPFPQIFGSSAKTYEVKDSIVRNFACQHCQFRAPAFCTGGFGEVLTKKKLKIGSELAARELMFAKKPVVLYHKWLASDRFGSTIKIGVGK